MRKVVLALVAISAMATASAAQATITITYTGTVSSGTDQTGALFTAGSSLAGKGFTATFLIDETTPGATVNQTPTQQNVSGSGGANPVQGFLTIDGAPTIHFGDTSGSNKRWDETWLDYLESRANNTPNTPGFYTYENLFFYLNNYSNGVSFYPNGVNYTVQPQDVGSGSFVLQTLDFQTFQNVRYVSGSLAIQNVSIANAVAAVPEPGTWAMMLIGFGGIGLAMSRRRRRSALAI